MLSMMVKRPSNSARTQTFGNDTAARSKESDMPLEQQMEGRATSSGLDSPVRTKVAIVTGASSGIGLEVTNRLVTKGYRVVANSRNITSAMTLQATDDLKLVDGDIGLPETAQRVVATAMRDFGHIDLLVNNAGVFIPKPFTDYLVEDFRRATETNLSGFFYVSQLAVSQMRLKKYGHVINISSSLVTQPIAGVAASLTNLTKGGLESVI